MDRSSGAGQPFRERARLHVDTPCWLYILRTLAAEPARQDDRDPRILGWTDVIEQRTLGTTEPPRGELVPTTAYSPASAVRAVIVAAVFALLSGLGLIVAGTATADPPAPPPPPPSGDCMLPWANPQPRCAGAPPLPCDRAHGGRGIPGMC